MSKNEDALGQGFRLAHFIISNRPAAIQILGDATSKLGLQRSRERKRAYWRYKNLQRRITRIIREDGDALQWLIYVESEKYEKEQERTEVLTTRQMIIRYVKHLVQITTARSCFYVNIGLHRLLYNYTTAEAQQAYEWVTEHYAWMQEYRQAKGALMNKLQLRFDKLLRTCRADHGEVKFEVLDEQDCWDDLIAECLRVFMPWSAAEACWVPRALGSPDWTPKRWLEKTLGKKNLDKIETYSSHAFIHPSCFSNLARHCGLDLPRQRLAIPRFFFEGDTEASDSQKYKEEVPVLTEHERQMLEARLEQEAVLRRSIVPQIVIIVIEGKEYARLDLAQKQTARCDLPDGVKLIEICAEDQGKRIPLAAHWVDYTERQHVAQAESVVDLGNQKELWLSITPRGHGAELSVRWQPMRAQVAKRSVGIFGGHWFQMVPRYAAVAACLLVAGWLLGGFKYQKELSGQREMVQSLTQKLADEKAAGPPLEQMTALATPANYRLQPDTLTRGMSDGKEATVILSSGQKLITLELAVGDRLRLTYRAKLESVLESKTILEENALSAEQTEGSAAVVVSVPVACLEEKKHYVITLDSVNGRGEVAAVRRFTFYVLKK